MGKSGDALRKNGYEVIRGKRLNSLKNNLSLIGGAENDFGTKITMPGIFYFRAFLNLAMLKVNELVYYVRQFLIL